MAVDLHNFQAETTSLLHDHLLCTEEEAVNLVSGLDTGKASGPDGISGRMLMGTIQSISPVHTFWWVCLEFFESHG